MFNSQADTYYGMGIDYGFMGRYAEAISALGQYLRLDPNSEEANSVRKEIARLRQQGY